VLLQPNARVAGAGEVAPTLLAAVRAQLGAPLASQIA
jgi:hypothetical protein